MSQASELSTEELLSLRGGYRKCRTGTNYECGVVEPCPAVGPCGGDAKIPLLSESGDWYECIYWFWESYCSIDHFFACLEKRPCVLEEGECIPDYTVDGIELEYAGVACLTSPVPPVNEP